VVTDVLEEYAAPLFRDEVCGFRCLGFARNKTRRVMITDVKTLKLNIII
jgi:hypothetical protein